MVVARADGVEINDHYVGPKEQGFASPAEHFGPYLALLAADDRRKREDEALPPDQVARWVGAGMARLEAGGSGAAAGAWRW
jgi:hypothetical protein